MEVIDITPDKDVQQRKIRLAAYVRVSSASEAQEHSYAAQILYFANYVKEHPEYELVDIYADEGITGTDMTKREELNRLLRDCQKGKIDRVICKSISRFARNTEELLHMIRMLKGFGVSIYFEDKDIDSNKLNMEMIVTFPGMAAQQESETISGNLRWSYNKRMKRGEFVCTCPAYGYEIINGQLVINETEAAVIRRTFDLYAKGNGFQTIANIYNKEKVPRRYGREFWHAHTIKYILTNEKYIGDSITQKSYTTDSLPYRRKPNNGEYAKYYVRDNHEGIIDREIFDAVQLLIQKRQNEPSYRAVYPLSGKLRCPDCGSTFRRQQHGEKVYWSCMKTASANSQCKSRRVREDAIYEAFLDVLYKLKRYQDELLNPITDALEFVALNRNKNAIYKLDKEIADLCAKQKVLSKLYSGGALSTDSWNAKKTEVEGALQKLRKQRRLLLAEQRGINIKAIEKLNEILSDYRQSAEFDSDIFDELIDKIVVNSNSRITFDFYGGLSLSEEIDETMRCQSL